MVQDDGYSQLTVHDYIACRTVPQLALMQQTLPPLSARKDHLQMLMYFMSALSVVFATVHADLYIAVSTAAISLCTGILEYQKLEVKVASLNRSIKELSKVLHDWDSCAFAYPRSSWRFLPSVLGRLLTALLGRHIRRAAQGLDQGPGRGAHGVRGDGGEPNAQLPVVWKRP